ncbi:MAG: carboxymuconolactone decarboxylase family protein [Actinobacteria bacterium]|nr:carboxymuconolactone decarboxylase family protein [Actinomycetota bacterium]
MPPDETTVDPDSARRAEGIAAYASQFGLAEEDVVPHMDALLGPRMAAEAQHSAAAAWREGALSRRDRSLIVIASLVSQGGVDARLRGHLRWAPENGVSWDELDELMSLLAVYVGYPKASVGVEALREELGNGEGDADAGQ